MNEQDKDQLRTRVAQRLGLAGPQKVDLVVLPALEVRMEPVTPARKAQLAASIEHALAERMGRDDVATTPTSLDDETVLAVCRTCQGSCCKWGETHAYLTRAVLTRVKRQRKVASEAALVEAYLDRVPDVARAGSCIYHGAKGCALPREMRSETCNRFICYPLKQLGQDFGSPGYAQLAVSTVEGGEDRVLLLSEGEAQEVSPPP